ncbi:MAG: hypothetical protein A2854_03150 [Parcubacteria group bacterium RIFCSPHIGHO2_01_FULL_56_18]|nr:MAG: hypothetical protein A2854_03150 [Parcubacteria group bacterium RIFCSPHIGHO2_01_FULL_56_18]
MASHTGKAWGILLCALLVPFLSYAQVSLTGLERPLDLAMTPEYPAGGDTVTFTVSSYGVDLDRSAIVWYANGKEIARGNGLTTTTVAAGKLGTATEITVIAEEQDGLIGSTQATIRPTEVDLLWEADSYSPPYFRGRTLAGTNATIRAQAIVRFVRPDGNAIPEGDIIYSWYKGTKRIASGRGKSSITAPGPTLFGTDTFSVTAESVDGLYHGRASARIDNVDSTIELYENHPLFGVLYHRALIGSATTLETELKVTAVPYFAHIIAPHETSLAYEWALDSTALAADPDHPETFTITTNNYTGPVTVELSLTSVADLFLKATGTWEIVFGESGSFFGNDLFGRPQ